MIENLPYETIQAYSRFAVGNDSASKRMVADRCSAAESAVHRLFLNNPTHLRYVCWKAAISRLREIVAGMGAGTDQGIGKDGHTLFCLGDSHSYIFDHADGLDPMSKLKLVACPVPGASAAGLVKQDSMVRSRLFLESYLSRIPSSASLLLCFGEVDCNSRIPARMWKYSTDEIHEINDSIIGYVRFLDLLSHRERSDVIVYGVHPPCQRKDKPGKERSLWLDLPRRTRITRLFNRRLEEICAVRGLRFLNLEDRLIDASTGVVRDKFLPRSATNHHLNAEALAPVVREAVTAFL